MAHLNPLTHERQTRVSPRYTAYSAVSIVALKVFLGMATGTLVSKWYPARHGAAMGLFQGIATFTFGRVVSNEMDEKYLIAAARLQQGNQDPNNQAIVMNGLKVLVPTLLTAIAAPAAAKLMGFQTTVGQVFKFHLLTLTAELAYGKVGSALIRKGRWPGIALSDLATRPFSSPYPRTGEKLNLEGLKQTPPELNLEELDDMNDNAILDICRGIDWKDADFDPTNRIKITIESIQRMIEVDARLSTDFVAGKHALKLFRNVSKVLAGREAAEQKTLLVRLGQALQRCSSQWTEPLEDIFKYMTFGTSGAEDAVAWVNQDLKNQALLDSTARILGPVTEDVHVKNTLKNVMREEIGIQIPGGEAAGGDAEAMVKKQLPQVRAVIEKQEAIFKANVSALKRAFLAHYTADMVVAKHLDFWNNCNRADLHGKMIDFLQAELQKCNLHGASTMDIAINLFLSEDSKYTQEGIVFLLKKSGILVDDGVVYVGVANDALQAKITEVEEARDQD